MQSNRLPVLIRFKSDLNRILIDFNYPIQAVPFTRPEDSIRIRTIYIKNGSIYIENGSIYIENSSIYIKNGSIYIKKWLNLIENGRNQK